MKGECCQVCAFAGKDGVSCDNVYCPCHSMKENCEICGEKDYLVEGRCAKHCKYHSAPLSMKGECECACEECFEGRHCGNNKCSLPDMHHRTHTEIDRRAWLEKYLWSLYNPDFAPNMEEACDAILGHLIPSIEQSVVEAIEAKLPETKNTNPIDCSCKAAGLPFCNHAIGFNDAINEEVRPILKAFKKE